MKVLYKKGILIDSGSSPVGSTIVPPKYSGRSAIIKVDRLSFAPLVGAATPVQRARRPHLDAQTSAQLRLENLALRQQTRRLASVGSKTPEAEASRPGLLGLVATRFDPVKGSFIDLGSEDIPLARCRPQKQNSSLSDLLHQAVLMMQAAKHRHLHNAVTGGQLVSVIAGRNAVLAGLRNSRT